MNRLLSVVILLSSVGLPFASAQQENPTVESRPWYQIELIVFENRGYRNPVDPEYWPRDILLAYPMLRPQFPHSMSVSTGWFLRIPLSVSCAFSTFSEKSL